MRDNILDSRFRGMAIKLSLVNGDFLEGIVDDVAKYELSLRIKDSIYIVFRHSITYLEIGASELHGERREELEDTLLTNDFVGLDVSILLINGARISGRLMKVSRYELGLRCDDRGFIVPKSSIIYIELPKM